MGGGPLLKERFDRCFLLFFFLYIHFFLSSISTIILFIPFKMLKWQSRNILKYVQCGWTSSFDPNRYSGSNPWLCQVTENVDVQLGAPYVCNHRESETLKYNCSLWSSVHFTCKIANPSDLSIHCTTKQLRDGRIVTEKERKTNDDAAIKVREELNLRK